MLRPFSIALILNMTLASPLWAGNDGSLDVAAPFEIKSADPTTSGAIFTRMSIAETLVDTDSDGRLIPSLATEWSVSKDELRWIFILRSGVSFHDGTPLTATAVIKALTYAWQKPGVLKKTPIVDIVENDGGVAVTLSEPFSALPSFFAEYRSQILAPAAYSSDGTVKSMIGTGPYRVTELEPPTTFKAVRFNKYWGEIPAIDTVTYTAVGRSETRALLAESGDADIVYSLDPATVTRLSQSDAVEVLSTAIPRSLILKINNTHKFLSELNARRALSMAIDRSSIAQKVLRYPYGADQLFPPSLAGWHSDAIPPLNYDPETAKSLLAGLGWQPGADGILERNKERFELTLTTYPDRPELPLVAEVLEQQWQKIGISLTINSTNFSEIPVKHYDGTLELALLARNFALVPDPIGTILEDYVSGGDWGAMGWNNPKFVNLVHKIARGSAAPESRTEAARILRDELPVIPIAWYRQTLAASMAIKGASIEPWERTLGLTRVSWAD